MCPSQALSEFKLGTVVPPVKFPHYWIFQGQLVVLQQIGSN